MSRTLYLIDGHAQIFRAYHAIRGGMTSPRTGEPTHAVFGMAGMMLRLLSEHHPDMIVMAIDTAGPTFRDALYSQYKANRDAPPEDLLAQEQRIFDMVRYLGIPVIGVPGHEADDIIATLCQRILQDPQLNDVHIKIVSRDKDLEQLLGPRVVMFDIHKNENIDVQTLQQKKNLRPDQVIDALTLTGDTADNIPGVKGVGPKTAAKLLQQFDNIQTLYENIDQIKGKRKENLLQAKDQITLTRQLVTLKRDVPIELDLKDATPGPIDMAALRSLFQTLGFRRHLTELEKLITPASSTKGPTTTTTSSSSESTPTPGNTSANSPANISSLPDAPGNPDRHTDTLFSTSHKTSAQRARPEDSQLSLFPTSLFETPPSAPTPSLEASPKTHSENQDKSAAPPLAVLPPPVPESTASDFDYHAITTITQLTQLVQTLKQVPILSVDAETVGLGRTAKLCGLCLAWKAGHAVYIPTLSPTPQAHLDCQTVLNTLRPLLEDDQLPKCGHNLKYDALVLHHAGIQLRGIVFDTMIGAQLLGMPSRSLDHLAMDLLGHQMIPISNLIGPRGSEQRTMDQVPLDQITPYAAEDADISLKLYEKIKAQIHTAGMDALAAVEMPLVGVLANMESLGILINPKELLAQKQELTRKIDHLKQAIFEAAGESLNLDSPKQMGHILFEKLNLPIIKKGKTGPSTDVQVLEKLSLRDDLKPEAAVVLEKVLAYRRFAKLVNTYLDSLRKSVSKKDGRIHATFQQLGTATGRLSSSHPNLQNIPVRTEQGKQIRKAFIPEPGWKLISADYSQIELRILAHLSEDSALIDAFNQDQDIHAAVASEVYHVPLEQVTPEQRSNAKVVNFGIIYGITAFGLAKRIDNLNAKQAAQLIEDYRNRFSGIDRFLRQCVNQALEQGYVTTILGRRRLIPQIHSTHGNIRSLGERLAINTVVQGSATGDLIKLAMVNLHRRIERENLPMRMLCQIHDELLFEAPPEAAQAQAKIIRQEMEQAMSLKVPLKVEVGIGDNWLDAK